MSSIPIEFDILEWIEPAVGIRYKEFVNGDKKMRLAEFTEGFIEEDRCEKAHVGYVLEGVLEIDFEGETTTYKAGDGIWIEEGPENKHKAVMKEGARALLLMFEDA